MAYPILAMPGRIRQGGNSWFQLFLQKSIGTPVTAAQLASRPAIEKVTRLFTSHDLDVAGDTLESEAVAGGIDRQENQPGQRWFEGPISTELYRQGMLAYIQAGLAAKRDTASAAITDVQVITTGTPLDVAVTTANREFTLGKTGASPSVDLTIQNQPTDDGAGIVSTPKQLQVKLEVGNSKMIPEDYWVKLKGVRKTGLGPYDVQAVEQQIDFTGAAAATKTSTINADDYYFSQVTAIEFKEPIGDAGSPETIELEILAKSPQKRTSFEETLNPFDGWTYIGSQAGGPLLGYDVVPTELTFNIGARMSLDMVLRSGLGWRNRTLVGGFLEKRTSFKTKSDDTNPDNSHPEYPSNEETKTGFPFIEKVFFPGYGGALVLDSADDGTGGHAIIFNDATIAINNGLDFLEGTRGSPHRLPLARSTEGRTIDCNFTSYYEDPDALPYKDSEGNVPANAPDYVDWTERYFDAQSTKVEVYAFYWDRKGKQTHHKITLRKCNVGEVTRRSIGDKGRVSQTVPLQVLRKGAESLVEWEVVDDAGWENPTYA